MTGDVRRCGVIFTDKRPSQVTVAFVVPYTETVPIGDGHALQVLGAQIVGELPVSSN